MQTHINQEIELKTEYTVYTQHGLATANDMWGQGLG